MHQLLVQLQQLDALGKEMLFSNLMQQCYRFFYSIFAGTAVMMNYVLMITWFPAAITILERFKLKQKKFQSRLTQSSFECIIQTAKNMQNTIIKWIVKFPLLWIVILGNF